MIDDEELLDPDERAIDDLVTDIIEDMMDKAVDEGMEITAIALLKAAGAINGFMIADCLFQLGTKEPLERFAKNIIEDFGQQLLDAFHSQSESNKNSVN